MSEELSGYIKKLLEKSVSREEIKSKLLAAGWPKEEVDEAMLAFSQATDSDVPPPPPPPQRTKSMVEIFVNFFSFILLGFVATAVGVLYFQIINRFVADPLAATRVASGIGRVNVSSVHYAIAALIVSFPLYVWAVYFWFSRFAKNAEKVESRLSKWLTYFVLLIAAGTVIGDLIAVVFNFLQGELSLRFFLKALTILLIAAFVFGFYYLERKKIQYKKEVPKLYYQIFAYVTIAVVIVGIVLGFVVAGTPGESRLRKFDLEKVEDLNGISLAVNSYAQSKGELPKDLLVLKNNPSFSPSLSSIPEEELTNYEYRIVSDTEYELCTEFNLSTVDLDRVPIENQYYGSDLWNRHEAGRVCKILNTTLSEGNLKAPVRPPID